MRHLARPICTVVLLLAGTAVHAQERTDTRALTCSAIKDFVARHGDVVLASSEMAYEAVHLNSMACASDETGAPAYAPSLDDPSCFTGWRCKQRSNDTPK